MDRDYWMYVRSQLIAQAKALAEQRAAVIGQYKAIERMLDIPQEPAPIHDTETSTTRFPYSA